MQSLRNVKSKLSYANVVATLALFVAMSTGGAWAVSQITSNSQVGPNTIAGHKPPSGYTTNIVTGSVNQTDLAAGSVIQGKIASNAVTTAKFAPTATAPFANQATSALQADFAQEAAKVSKLFVTSGTAPASTSEVSAAAEGTPGSLVSMSVGEEVTLFESPPFTLSAVCIDEGEGVYRVRIEATSTEEGWIGGSGGAEPHAAGEMVEVTSDLSDAARIITTAPSVVAAPSTGASLSLGAASIGVHIGESDCIVNQYAIG